VPYPLLIQCVSSSLVQNFGQATSSKKLFHSRGRPQIAVAAIRVWEGKSRGKGDLTEEFGHYAQMKGLKIFDVMTR
jgi:hypothetical protein